jgi:hypothetical protein
LRLLLYRLFESFICFSPDPLFCLPCSFQMQEQLRQRGTTLTIGIGRVRDSPAIHGQPSNSLQYWDANTIRFLIV